MRKLALLLVVLLVASIFVGCGTQKAPQSEPAEKAEPAEQEETESKVSFPERPITIIVPNAPGGGSDLTARAIAQFSEKYLGVSMIVDNRPGGGQTVAHTYFKSVPNDGYTLIIYGNSGTTVAPLIQKTEYDPFKDEEPIGRVTNLRNVLVVRSDAPYQTLEEFVKYCQENPGVKLATSGANGIDDLTARMMNLKYNTGIVPVAYDSGSEAALAVLSGECEVACTSVTGAQTHVEQGKLTVLCVACDDPDSNYPEYKTAKELGYDVALNNSIGFAVPAGTDPQIKAILEKFLADVTSDPEFVKMYTDMNMSVDYLNAKDFLDLVTNDYNNVKAILDAGA